MSDKFTKGMMKLLISF